jgi:3'-phosphoadenosine 5'-phosphosulfate (PAPS) 3'-phosphatase
MLEHGFQQHFHQRIQVSEQKSPMDASDVAASQFIKHELKPYQNLTLQTSNTL